MKRKNAGKGKKRKQSVHVSVVGKPKNNTEKHLLSDNREFASIFQLVLKDERINPDELRDYSETDTVTKVERGEIALSKEFVRDIRKLWVKTDGRKVYLCIENQTELDVKDQVRMTLYTLVHILSIMEKTGEVLPIVPLIIVWGKKGENEELNIHDLFPKDTPEEIMKYQMYLRIPVIYVLGIKEKDVEILSIPLKEAIILIQLMSKELEFDQVERYVSKLKNIVKIMLSDSAQKTVIAVTGHDFYENIKLGKEDAVTFGSINDVLEDLKVKVAADAKAEGITEGRIENLVENVIKLSKVKNYSYEESLDILAEDEKEKEEALKRIKELEK